MLGKYTVWSFLPFWVASCVREPPPEARRVTLESGVVLTVTEEGSGPTPDEDSYVAIDYEAFLADGKALGSPRQGRPFIFRVGDENGAIVGLREAVTQLREGGRARVEIPAALAYREVGKPPIPPNTALVYDLHLTHVFRRSESGLQYVIVEPGDDSRPEDGKQVVIDYRGILLQSGREFASSKQRGGASEEFVFGVGIGLPGLEEGLRMLGVGGRGWLIVPPALGYGKMGRLPAVPPGQDLFFDVRYKGTRRS